MLPESRPMEQHGRERKRRGHEDDGRRQPAAEPLGAEREKRLPRPSGAASGRPSLKRNAAPRTTSIIASVMMNGGIRVRAASAPFAAPMPAAVSSPMLERRAESVRKKADGDDADERDHRADAQVDAADQDHQRHPERDDRVDGNLLREIEQVFRRQKTPARNPDREEREQNDDRADQDGGRMSKRKSGGPARRRRSNRRKDRCS